MASTIVTTWVRGLGAAAPGVVPASITPSATANRILRLVSTSRPLLQRRLEMPGMLEVRDERRADLDQQSLEVGIAGAGNQRLVDGVQHLLVVGDFMVDV